MAFMFENLQVYQKAVDFADRTTELAGQFPRGYYFLADKLNRASLSISANIAEGKAVSPNRTARTSSPLLGGLHRNASHCLR